MFHGHFLKTSAFGRWFFVPSGRAKTATLYFNLARTHVDRLYYKLAVADRVGLVVRAMDEFLTLTAAPESILPSICANRTAGRCPLRRR